ncbi:MAG: sodium:solute symporter family transporter, partial [Planctomycetota bacterium]
MPFAPFNESPRLNAAGDFWNDAMVGTFAFYLINQGVLMRFLSARSVREGRRAMLVIVLVLMPLLAVAVSGAGWIGRSMVSRGQIDPTTSDQIFIAVTRLVTGPGLFGLVVAAVIAALMSTLDTLLSAVSAVAVNDIWRTVRPGRDDAHYLRAARGAAI